MQIFFFCFLCLLAYPGTKNSLKVWKPFLSNLEECGQVLNEECGLVEIHSVHSVHANRLSLDNDDKFTEASYIASIMHNQQRVSRYFSKFSSSYMNNEYSNVITSEMIDLMKNRLYLESNAHLGNVVLSDYDNVYSSCNRLKDGWYYIKLILIQVNQY